MTISVIHQDYLSTGFFYNEAKPVQKIQYSQQKVPARAHDTAQQSGMAVNINSLN
jgi:hypothetical protein